MSSFAAKTIKACPKIKAIMLNILPIFSTFCRHLRSCSGLARPCFSALAAAAAGLGGLGSSGKLEPLFQRSKGTFHSSRRRRRRILEKARTGLLCHSQTVETKWICKRLSLKELPFISVCLLKHRHEFTTELAHETKNFCEGLNYFFFSILFNTNCDIERREAFSSWCICPCSSGSFWLKRNILKLRIWSFFIYSGTPL